VIPKKGKRGGARPGAGRKPILKDAKSIKLSLDGDVYDRLAEIATEREVSIGALAREAVEAFLPKRRRRNK
jgi:hypothetical protein